MERVSTLGAGPSPHMQPAMKRIISASLMDSAAAGAAPGGQGEPGKAFASDRAESVRSPSPAARHSP